MKTPFSARLLFLFLLGLGLSGCRRETTAPPSDELRPPISERPIRTKSPRTNKSDSNEGNLLLGNATRAGRDENNFLLERRQYSMSYNRSRGGPNWVAWHTDGGDLGEIDRGKFRPDSELPREWQITPGDYRKSGYDRGHVCPSGDRTRTRRDNDATFLMSNMLPQTGELNRNVWAELESWVREQVRSGYEAYQIAGGAGENGTIAGGKIVVPGVCWKVIVLIPEGKNDLGRIDANTRVVGVGIPNLPDPRLEKSDWRAYIVAPSKIERAANIQLFTALPPTVRKVLVAKVDSGR